MTEFRIDNISHVVIFTTQSYLSQANDSARKQTKVGHKCEVVIMPNTIDEARQILTRQPLGSGVLIYGEEDSSQVIEHLALSAGFSKHEIWINKSSVDNMRGFCSQCHLINEISSFEFFECENCHIKLQPSNHYSTYHRAYLAYPVIN
ncbi:hypothetical protein [Pseudalkalibacillus hwajinpoensis]|uniref:Dimethylamine monooxygenase subunit DmmA-like C-terminal domain-containing protein n=1 Tax=Guptibacillus hwajinpoensis TaxID=208199 RepID=A0A4V5PYG5_9BACL|nr:hypothetical protein [Pseudalkalibacillus hwajinpoensis]TKD69988.1 hypothetical protein FBF83_12035 [Pseudalkalibacillus hwajinpoensis]